MIVCETTLNIIFFGDSLSRSIEIFGPTEDAGFAHSLCMFSQFLLSAALWYVWIQDWEQKFWSILKLRCAVLTGDTNTTLADCLATDIILSTPEKVRAHALNFVLEFASRKRSFFLTPTYLIVGFDDAKMEELLTNYRNHKASYGDCGHVS
jgi:hypothetical protein